MRQLHSYRALDRQPLALIFDRDIPDRLTDFPERRQRRFWANDAHELVNYLYNHLPAALIDAVYADMGMRQASVSVEAYGPESTPTEEANHERPVHPL